MAQDSQTLGLSSVAFSVSSLTASREFFEALGFHEMAEMQCHTPNHSLMLTDGSVVITLWQIHGEAQPFDRRHNIGLHHVSLRVRSMKDLHDLYNKASNVKGAKSEFGPLPLVGTNMVRAVVIEPCGIQVELTCEKE